jgi:hypothetical protein
VNAIALGFFEISYRAEAQKGSGMHYMGQSFRAARPNECAELGFPNDSVRYGSIASRTSRRSGVVAA